MSKLFCPRLNKTPIKFILLLGLFISYKLLDAVCLRKMVDYKRRKGSLLSRDSWVSMRASNTQIYI